MTSLDQDISGIQQEKQVLRDNLRNRDFSTSQANKRAELLRGQADYKHARQIFVSPAPALQQVRVNCLLDGKDLVMPSAGLKEGFFLFKPYSIPFQDLPFAVTMKGAPRFAKKLRQADVEELQVDLLATDAVAVDSLGSRLGDGLGFFDLSYAVLKTLGALTEEAKTAICVGIDQRISATLPVTPWDVPADMIVTEKEVQRISKACGHRGEIFWEQLSGKKIKKMTPLWWLQQNKV
ncbi:MAG: hypothetical protein KQH63_12365 [Desulfobulbaceae bacterium]|nr:hypothetical protein [Desulfobulbaceae bacterium]